MNRLKQFLNATSFLDVLCVSIKHLCNRQVTKDQHDAQASDRIARFFTSLRVVLVVFSLPIALFADDSAPTQSKQVGKSALRIELRESSDSATFALLGLTKIEWLEKLPSEELQKLMSVRVQESGLTANPVQLLGEYSLVNTELRFKSRFPLSPSVQYLVELLPRLTGSSTGSEFILLSQFPKKRMAPATVSAVYPSSDVLPENVLKFYIHFSAPMSRGEAYKRIHLMHEDIEVESPFLELGEELWDIEQKRFTLIVHPGRIKQGLKPREISGAPMLEGKIYRLVIDSKWMGADMQPLAASFVKQFRVVGADSQQPDPKRWKVIPPNSNSNQPVSLTFDESLDHALLNRVVSLRDASGKNVLGTFSITLNETVLSFIPMEQWKPGAYSFQLESKLEDMAGNSLARPFETIERESGAIVNVESEIAIEWIIP